MRSPTLLAGLALATLFAVACDNAVESRRDGRPLPAPDAPAFSVGPTATVQVLCPAKLQTGGFGYCYAISVDSLGFATGSSVDSWSGSNVNVLVVSSTGQIVSSGVGTATVTATIDGVTGSKSVKVSTSVDPSVSIDGSPLAKPNVACSFVAQPSGGEPPYTYVWTKTGSATGSASGDTWTGQSPSTYTLSVVLTDSDGRKATASHTVTVLSGAPNC